MRFRIAAPVLTGALALGTLAMPAAAYAATPAPVITHVALNGLVLGLSGKATESLHITVTDPAGVKTIKALPYPANMAAPTLAEMRSAEVEAVPFTRTATGAVVNATHTEAYDVRAMHLPNRAAGMVLKLAVLVVGRDGQYTYKPQATTFTMLKRADVLTEKTSATAVRKGANLTVRGQLNRADWTAYAWKGYAARPVLLQFRKAGSSTWTTVRTVRTSATGALATTLRDYHSGSWRYVYAGDAASGSAASAPIAVTVR